MGSGFRVAASVTLYNSRPDCVAAITSYQNQVERIYLIDNSEQPDFALIRQLTQWSNVQYVAQGGNKGVAVALNTAARLALEAGFDFLLTMDDDTRLPAGAVQTMLAVATAPACLNRVGIVSGTHTTPSQEQTHRQVPFTMTSGNLLNLAIYQQTGPFRDDFFIDHIDHEYGLRLTKAGFHVVELPGIVLHHQLGERKTGGWGAYQFVSHSPLRGYYMARNGWVTWRLYPAFRRQLLTILSKEVLKTLFFESQKKQRLQLLWRGLRDAHRNRLGKFTN